jgi:hypothetical protein
MQRQSSIRVLAVGFITVGVIHAVIALFIIGVYGGKSTITPGTGREFLPVIGLLGNTSVVLVIIASLLGVFAGLGLWNLSPWARPLGVAVSLIFVIPFGTLLGAVGLLLLCRKRSLNNPLTSNTIDRRE